MEIDQETSKEQRQFASRLKELEKEEYFPQKEDTDSFWGIVNKVKNSLTNPSNVYVRPKVGNLDMYRFGMKSGDVIYLKAEAKGMSLAVTSRGIAYFSNDDVRDVIKAQWSEIECVEYDGDDILVTTTDDAVLILDFSFPAWLIADDGYSIDLFVSTLEEIRHYESSRQTKAQEGDGATTTGEVSRPSSQQLTLKEPDEKKSPKDDPVIQSALKRYGMTEIVNDSQFAPFLPVLGMMGQVDGMLEQIEQLAISVDNSLAALRDQVSQISDQAYDLMRDCGFKRSTSFAVSAVVDVVGEFYAQWKQNQEEEKMERRRQYLSMVKCKIANGRMKNMLVAKEYITKAIVKSETLYEAEMKKQYDIADPVLEKKIKVFKMIVMIYGKLLYLSYLVDFFIEVFDCWQRGEEELPDIPDSSKVYGDLAEMWTQECDLKACLTEPQDKYSVSFLLALQNSFIARHMLGQLEYNWSTGYLVPSGCMDIASGKTLALSPKVEETLQKNDYYQALNTSVAEQPGRTGLWVKLSLVAIGVILTWVIFSSIWVRLGVTVVLVFMGFGLWGLYEEEVEKWQKETNEKMSKFKF
ncbi:MAG: hypothetical protein LUC85_00735 [Bacteroidales bacterium]|nr:hypothetical protein [Bacteroidales bacterium]MCD8393345.1 hypothetical protein [Bacteroidales bacterium]